MNGIKEMWTQMSGYMLSLSPEIRDCFSAGMVSVAFSVIVTAFLLIAAKWKMFRRADVPGWHSIIPILATWDGFKLAWGQKAAAVSLMLNLLCVIAMPFALAKEIPAVLYGIVAVGVALGAMELMCMWRLCRVFGKGFWFFMGMLFFPVIFRCVLGFGELKYTAPEGRK